jgi:YVTN family beta-propeller protein
MRDDTVSVIDLSELEVVKTLKVGKTPFGLLVIPAMDGQNF